MVLFRCALGDTLRQLRHQQGRRLADVAAAAHVSTGHLSGIERGQSEASSELLAAICGALDAAPSQVFREISDRMDGRRTGLRTAAATEPPPGG